MDRIAIVGLGLIGGSLALALRDRRPSLRILGVDLDPESLRLATKAGAIEQGSSPEEAALESCDVVVLATPAAGLMEAILPAARRMVLSHGECGAVRRCGEREAAASNPYHAGRCYPRRGPSERGKAVDEPTIT